VGLGRTTKESQIPVDPFPVVRLFVHWMEQVDDDLSALLLDAEMRSMGHVSWTRRAHTHGDGLPMMVHSGDIQNAPARASEFIDVSLAALAKAGVAYVGTSPISFCGKKFGSFPCFAGWRRRDAQRSGELFEPASVRARLDIASGGTGHLPLVPACTADRWWPQIWSTAEVGGAPSRAMRRSGRHLRLRCRSQSGT